MILETIEFGGFSADKNWKPIINTAEQLNSKGNDIHIPATHILIISQSQTFALSDSMAFCCHSLVSEWQSLTFAWSLTSSSTIQTSTSCSSIQTQDCKSTKTRKSASAVTGLKLNGELNKTAPVCDMK